MKKHVLAIIAATIAAVAALSLTGCGSITHQAVNGLDSCVNCHSGQYQGVLAGGYKAENVVVTTSVTFDVIVTGADTVYICTPVGNTQNNIPIPIILTSKKVTPGEPTTITLSDPMFEGNWMLVIQAGGKVASQMVRVDPDATAGTVDLITLKL